MSRVRLDMQAPDIKGLKECFEVLTGREVRLAQASTLNNGAQKVRTATVRGTSGDLKIKKNLIRKRMRISRANSKRTSARVFGAAQGVPLIKLKAKTVPGGVQAGGWLVPGGFIATPTATPKWPHPRRQQPSTALIGKAQVFKRKGDDRYPIDASKVNIKPAMWKHMRNRSQQFMKQELEDVMRAQFKYRVLRKAGRVRKTRF